MRQLGPAEKPKSEKVNLTEYWRILWRKKFFVLLPMFLSGVIAVVGVRFINPVYKSSAILRLEEQKFVHEDIARPVILEEERIAVNEKALARMRAEIKSSNFLDKVIRDLGLASNPELIATAKLDQQALYPDLTVPELVKRRLRSMLSGKIRVSLAGPAMFRVSAFDYSPEHCHTLATVITDLFIESRRTRELQWLRDATEFSDEQLAVYKTRLEDTEGELERVQGELTRLALRKNPVGEMSARYAEEFGGGSNLRYAETLKEQLDSVIRDREDTVRQIEKRIAQEFGTVPLVDKMRDDAELQHKESGLIAFYEARLIMRLGAEGVTGEDQAETREEIRDEERTLQRYITDKAEIVYEHIDPDHRLLIVEYFFQEILLRGVKATNERLETDIAAYKNKLYLTPRLEAELEKLRQRRDADWELYQSFLKAKTSAQISEAAQNTDLGSTIEVLEKPARPLIPDHPDRRKILLFVVAIGGSLGLLGIVFSEYIDSSFRTVEEIEARLGLRVIGTIPRVESSAGWRRAGIKKQVVIWGVVSAAAIALSIAGFYVAGKKAQKHGMEVYTNRTIQQGDR